jgi:hypothetical protein
MTTQVMRQWVSPKRGRVARLTITDNKMGEAAAGHRVDLRSAVCPVDGDTLRLWPTQANRLRLSMMREMRQQ